MNHPAAGLEFSDRDPIVEAVRQKLLDRSQVGVQKYGVTLADSKEDIIARLNHLQQELMDGANYVEWVMREIKDAQQKSQTT